MKNYVASVVCTASLVFSACADSNPSAPSPTTPPTSPTQPTPPSPPVQLYTLTGTVTNVASGAAIPGALVRVVDGPNAGMQVASDGAGRYTLSGLTFAGFTVSVQAPNMLEGSAGALLQSGIYTRTVNFTMRPAMPWSISGSGNTVFTMPTYFTRVSVHGHLRPGARSSNFIVHVGGRTMVNEILSVDGRNGWAPTYDGTHLTSGGTVDIVSSADIVWTFTENR